MSKELDTPLSQQGDYPIVNYIDGKNQETYDEIDEKKQDGTVTPDRWTAPEDWLARFVDGYSGQHGGETLPPGSDPYRVATSVFTMNDEEALLYLKNLLIEIPHDYSFDTAWAARIRDLSLGHEHCQMEYGDWAYEVCRDAGICHNWSCYAEVRAVLLPYDDPDTPCESFRAYFLGIFWICVATLVNTFFAPRQPGISIPGQFIQLLLVPMGRGLAVILPDWGFTMFGTRWTLNTGGEWSSKEQLLSTLMATQASGTGNFNGLIVLRMPMFFDQKWSGYGYSLLLAISNQCYGLGMAGILRRLTVYPTQAVWPANLPTLALNRTLVSSDQKGEVVNKWKITRWHAFLASACVFIVWYWIPNDFLQAIRYFNWMTWIAPNNFKLGLITGSWGGMGFNPISSLDPLTSGSGTMNAPFFAQLQQYVMRVIAGIILIAMYFANVSWAGYMPINSNASFDNTMKNYNLTRILNPKDNTLDLDAYKAYSPPYYSIGYLFNQGTNFTWITFAFVYIFIRYWNVLKKAFYGMYINMRKRQSIYTGFDDGNCRIMRAYPEVPEWWYMIVLFVGFILSIVTVAAFPTETPWWTIPALTVIGTFICIPWCVIESVANVGIPLGILWNVLPGVWFPGKFLPDLMLLMLGDAFTAIAGSFAQDLKYAHYARIPPRAMFRSHILAQVLNVIMYVSTIALLESLYDSDNTMCQWDNKNYMVCGSAHSVYSTVVSFGVLGTNNLFALYPALKWCFLLGPLMALAWALSEKAGPVIRRRLVANMDAEQCARFDTRIWEPVSTVLQTVHPAIALSGAATWGGNQNLSNYTLALYLSFLFQYYLKRNYTAWWGKYAFLLFAGLSVGGTISGFISTLIFSFGAGKGASFDYKANTIGKTGVDWKLYNNEISYLPLPEVGYFGLAPGDYPVNF
ncbi:oligopeptide transporter 2 [Kockovaella imperatae]|uniref:Oligopeptide transporter 2 n=1 Tax=Kockovaella imperatae TaxID=4999 RepID=A0A1Y1U9R3_9TREE|nr:oligopeptide transporter 2 [Kockovaella imperatae]ORX34771.1 oligopeptide transporter 2 [Kockovaella imperatae]